MPKQADRFLVERIRADEVRKGDTIWGYGVGGWFEAADSYWTTLEDPDDPMIGPGDPVLRLLEKRS